ncbi:MAG: DMT family transporter [Pseudomonadota bacterium]
MSLQAATQSAGGHVRVSGVFLVVTSMALLTINDVLMKLLVAGMPLGQAVAMRGAAGCAIMIVAAPWLGGLEALRPRSLRNAAVLSSLLLIALFLFPWSLQRMPIADGIMLVSLSPVLAAMLSPWMLKERVGWRRWMAILLGLFGAVLVIDPGGADAGWVMLVPLIVALIVALRDVLTRSYIAAESVLALVFAANVFSVVAGAATLPYAAITPDALQWGYIWVTGSLMTISLAMTTAAFQRTGAVTVSCLKYSAIIWAALLGWLIWGDRLTMADWTGAVLITVSGVVIAMRTRA